MSDFPIIVLTSNDGKTGVTGELVLETSINWQVAVAGKVGVYEKTAYYRSMSPVNSFGDIFSSFGMSR